MSIIRRVRVSWDGFIGAPGISTFYFGPATADMTPLKTYLTALNIYLPTGVTLTIPNTGDILEDTTGQLQGVFTVANGGVITGLGGATPHPGGSGFLHTWTTAFVINGHKLLGKTFFVPSHPGVFANDGTLNTGIRTTMEQKGNDMIAAFGNNFLVWARPFTPPANNPAPGQPGHKVARLGGAAQATTCRVPNHAVQLRSRRQ